VNISLFLSTLKENSYSSTWNLVENTNRLYNKYIYRERERREMDLPSNIIFWRSDASSYKLMAISCTKSNVLRSL
jgi:hypothetical protein